MATISKTRPANSKSELDVELKQLGSEAKKAVTETEEKRKRERRERQEKQKKQDDTLRRKRKKTQSSIRKFLIDPNLKSILQTYADAGLTQPMIIENNQGTDDKVDVALDVFLEETQRERIQNGPGKDLYTRETRMAFSIENGKVKMRPFSKATRQFFMSGTRSSNDFYHIDPFTETYSIGAIKKAVLAAIKDKNARIQKEE